MMLLKLAALESVAIAGSSLDQGSEKIVLWSAALAGVVWIWMQLVKPFARWLRSIFRSAEAFEHLPEWMATMEAEVGKVIATQNRMENRQRAFNRDMGIRARGDVELAGEPADAFDGPSESA